MEKFGTVTLEDGKRVFAQFKESSTSYIMNKEQNLISQYEDMCIRWGASKDPRKANILFDKIRKTEFELKQTEQGIQQLLLALKYTEGFVR